jgi:SAM-dependent methyltransferase
LPSYYPNDRWEWDIVIDQVKSNKARFPTVLEVGCGSGEFLSLLVSLTDADCIGLDTAKSSVELCVQKNLKVYCETIESFKSHSSFPEKKFDFVLAFHCLEHVSNPKDLVISMLSVLNQNGSILLSTPYSPISYEVLRPELLNDPPHHLTRWNFKSYNELARQLDLDIEYFMPQGKGRISRTLLSIINSSKGLDSQKLTLSSKFSMILSFILKNPLKTYKIWSVQSRRDVVNGKTAADCVLVRLIPRK